ncbi:MAG: ABC transporter permease [Chitinophagaceae bacterium]
MLKNYLTIAWRNLQKNKIYSVLNIAGLAIGMASFILICLYVGDELSYDRFNDKADRIYRINSDIRFGASQLHMPVTPDVMGAILVKDYPAIEQFTRIYNSNGNKLIKKDNVFITETHVAHVDSTFFDVFTIPAIEGNEHTALNDPNSVVITETAAIKYFGTTKVLGKTIETNDSKTPVYKITAVVKDIPTNSHFHFDFLFSMKNADYEWGQFTSHNFYTYLLLKPGTDPRKIENDFNQYVDKYVLPAIRQFVKITNMDDFKKTGNQLEYSLIPLTKIHLHSDRSLELSPSGNIQYVYIFSAVAIFILLIACINFMNLATARSASRAKEVGIRKVLGTERRYLVFQFLTESTLIAIFSMLVAITIASLVLPPFNQLANKSLSLRELFSPFILSILILLPVLVGILAGSYPAFFLSGFRPIEVLKGKLNLGKGNSPVSLRSALVVFQFATSTILIVGTLVIYKQLHFIQKQDLGFNKDEVVTINNTHTLGDQQQAFKNSILQMNGVLSGTLSSYLPVSNSSRSDNTYFKEPVPDLKTGGIDMQSWRIDEDYLKTLGIKIVQGRGFSRDFPGDSLSMIINETTAKFLGYADPIGHKIYQPNDEKTVTVYTVIGVTQNFNFESLKQGIGPLCFVKGKWSDMATFKINTADVNGLVKKIEKVWKQMSPSMPFQFTFLDDSFNEMYLSEQRVGKIAILFATLAITIACMGLFGLATFIAEQRKKEIGIRKVLGASVQAIVHLLSKDFLKLVTIAFVIATPLSLYFMNRWLSDFTYRVPLEWWIFGLAGVISLIIALVTVSFQAIRASLSNPVKSLKAE